MDVYLLERDFDSLFFEPCIDTTVYAVFNLIGCIIGFGPYLSVLMLQIQQKKPVVPGRRGDIQYF